MSRDMWENTLLVVVSDNGAAAGAVAPKGSAQTNHPFRGGKFSDLEGGVRSFAFASGGAVPPSARGSTAEGYMHIADWFATFCRLAGVDSRDAEGEKLGHAPVEPYDMWPMLTANATSPRTEIVLSALPHQCQPPRPYFDPSNPTYWEPWANLRGGTPPSTWNATQLRQASMRKTKAAYNEPKPKGLPGHPSHRCLGNGLENGGWWTMGEAIIQGRYKAVWGEQSSRSFCPSCLFADCGVDGCLYDIVRDPTESHDLAEEAEFAEVLEKLRKRMDEVRQHEVVNPIRGNLSPLACKTVIESGGFYGPFLTEDEWWSRFRRQFSNETGAFDDPQKRYGITDEDMKKGRSPAKRSERRQQQKGRWSPTVAREERRAQRVQ